MPRRHSSIDAAGLSPRARRDAAASVLAGTAAGALAVFQSVWLGRAVDDVFIGGATAYAIRSSLWLLAGVMLGKAALAWTGDVLAQRAAARVKTLLRGEAVAGIVRRGPLARPGDRTGEIARTLSDGLDDLDAYIGQFLPQAALAILVPLMVLVTVAALDPLSGVALGLTGPLMPLFMWLAGATARARAHEQWVTLARLSARFLDAIRALGTLKTFGRAHDEARILEQAGDRFRAVTMSVLRVAFLSALILELLATIGVAIVAVEVGLRLLYGRIAFREAFIVLMLAPEFYRPLRTLGSAFHAGLAGREALTRVAQLQQRPAPGGAGSAAIAATHSADAAPRVTMRNVTFAYHDDGPPAVRDVSIEIPPGTTVALVGPTGSGKSTIASLALGFAVPQSGAMDVDGRAMDAPEHARWRRRVAWVPQRPHLFHGTLMENLLIARPGASEADVWRSLERARADGFVRALPGSLHTPLGERGERLSSGQAQRVALARAFLKDAPFVVLDEPTAQLDPETESSVSASIAELRRGRTVLLVAHRLATVETADSIVVLAGGQVVETGTHASLLAAGGRYAAMLAASASRGAQAEARGVAPDVSLASQPAVTPQRTPPTAAASGAAPHLSLASRINASAWPWLAGLARPQAGALSRSALLQGATGAFGVALMATSAWLIATAAGRPSIAALGVAIVGVRFFGLARGVSRYVERLATHETTLVLLARIRVRLFRALVPLGPAWQHGRGRGDLLARLVSDIETLNGLFVRIVLPSASAALVAILALGLLGWDGWWLAAAAAPGFVAAGVVMPALAERLGRRQGERLVAGRAALADRLADLIQGLPDLLIFDGARSHVHRLGRLNRSLALGHVRAARVSALGSAGGIFAADLTALGVFVFAALLARDGRLDGVQIAVAILATMAAFDMVSVLPPAFQSLGGVRASTRRLREIDETAPPVCDPVRSAPPPAGRRFEVRSLRFAYPGERDAALDDLDLVLERGRIVALVGATGSGKSTLVRLLARHWDVGPGMVALDGRDVRDYSADDVRACLSVADQPVVVLTGTVRENLTLSAPAATDAELMDAVERVGLGSAIRRLPLRLDTWVGEQGVALSGGERQRLAIARALLRPAPFLILDEPTAHLDARSEADLLRVIAAERASRGVLLATHRLAGLECADEIVVLHEGRVVQRGSFAELSAGGGWFRRMLAIEAGLTPGLPRQAPGARPAPP